MTSELANQSMGKALKAPDKAIYKKLDDSLKDSASTPTLGGLNEPFDDLAYTILTNVLDDYEPDAGKLQESFSTKQDGETNLEYRLKAALLSKLEKLCTLSIPSADNFLQAGRQAAQSQCDIETFDFTFPLHTQVVERGKKWHISVKTRNPMGEIESAEIPEDVLERAGTGVKTTSRTFKLTAMSSPQSVRDDELTQFLRSRLPSLHTRMSGEGKNGWRWDSCVLGEKRESRASVGVNYISSSDLGSWKFVLPGVGKTTVEPDVPPLSTGEKFKRRKDRTWTLTKDVVATFVPDHITHTH